MEAAGPEEVSPEERARRIKYNIPDDPAKRALTPEQQAAIARLTGTQPGGPADRYGRSHAAPPRHSREIPPPERVRQQVPVANRPAAERPVANDAGTERPTAENSENRGPADARPGRDTRGGPADSDALQAENAELKKQLADLRTRNADLETQNVDLKTEVGELRTQLAERDDKLAEQATDIGALKEMAGKHEAAIGELLGRVARMENAGADGPVRGVERRESPESEAPSAPVAVRDTQTRLPDVGDAAVSNPAEELISDRGDREELKANPRLSILHRGPSGDAIGFMEKVVVGGAGAGSYMMAQDFSHISGWVGYGVGVCIAGLAWARSRKGKGKA